MTEDNILITMSGGTTTVINATLAGILAKAKQVNNYRRVYAGFPGIEGVLQNKVVDLTRLSGEQILRLRRTPGSASVGTTRIAPLDQPDLEQLAESFDRLRIGSYINIGGNGTIKQTKQIAESFEGHVRVAAAPKTVDNDLGDPECRKVFFTPGFPSCVNHWVRTLKLLDLENRGAASHDRVLVAQTFGRDTGFLAGAIRVADPERRLPLLLLLPEDTRSIDEITAAIEKLLSQSGRALVVLSEGYQIGELGQVTDKTGQTMYGSCKTTAAQLLVDELVKNNIQARSYIPTVLQRQAAHDRLEFDLDIAERLGADAVTRLAEGQSDFLASVLAPDKNHTPEEPIDAIPFSAFSDLSRSLHHDYIAFGAFDVTDAYIDYLLSLFRVGNKETSYDLNGDDFFIAEEICETI